MKRSGIKSRQELKLKQRLELTRTIIRELDPAQLARINAGLDGSEDVGGELPCPPGWTY